MNDRRTDSQELRALQQMRRLELIADVALAHAGLDEMLDDLLDRLRDTVGVDTVAVLLVDSDGRGDLVTRAAKGLEEDVEHAVSIPLGHGFAGSVATARRPIALTDVKDVDVLNPVLRERGVRSLLGVPLIVEGRVIGVLHVGSLTRREFESEDVQLLELAAARIGPAIEHARLYDAERRAREEAEAAVAELRAIQTITDAVLAHLGLDELLNELLDRLREILRADTAAILLHDPESRELIARAAKGIEGEVERGVRVPVGRGFAGRIAAERRVVAVGDIATIEVVNPLLRERGIRSLLGAPLMVEADVRGVVHVGTLTRRAFTDADCRVLQLAADRIAIAIDRAQLLHERDVALTLQQSMLPERLPMLPRVTIAARHRPSPRSPIGGDWYDALPLPDGRIGLAIGDVVSRGVRAATVMVQVRTALRTHALTGAEPAEVVDQLARMVRSLERREMVTLVYAVLEPATGELRYVAAGHPPPLLVDSGGARYLEGGRSAPLGAVAHPTHTHAAVDLAGDSLVLLYTDGLIERRGQALDEGLDLLAASVLSGSREPEELCDALVERLVEGDVDDDVALLAVRTADLDPDRVELFVPAVPTSLAAIRRALRQWLERHDASAADVMDILVATGEAAANAVEHAYGPGDERFELTGVLVGREAQLTVRDFGRWRPPRGQNRGRGTLLMQELMDSFEVETTNEGTVVRMRRRLGMREVV